VVVEVVVAEGSVKSRILELVVVEVAVTEGGVVVDVWFGRRVKALWWVSKRRGVEDERRSWGLNWWGRKWERGVNCSADEICKIRVSGQGYRLRFYFNRGLKLPNIASIEKQPRPNVFSQAPILKFSFMGCLIGFGS